MQWTPQQEGALAAVKAWYGDPHSDQVFRLFGYAGTGKTTLAKEIAESVAGLVLFAAPTGKAASVLREKGCKGAQTLHSLIYKPSEKGRKRLDWLKEELEKLESAEVRDLIKISQQKKKIEEELLELSKPKFRLNLDSLLTKAALLILDESSMIDAQVGQDLLTFDVKILALGDPAQLPPVKGGGFFTRDDPDIVLTDVQRQARDNPIIDLATRVRLGETLRVGTYGTSRVLKRNQIKIEDILAADQLLVGLNATRRASNSRIRHVLGHDSILPVREEKVVCLRNDKDIGLMNGQQFTTFTDAEMLMDETLLLTVLSDDENVTDPISVEAHLGPFIGENLEMPWWERKIAQEFDFGYAMTVHKSQGSQWNSVVVLDEWRQALTHKKWLYTAITRAAHEVTIVDML